jgi:hypothetical protein
MPGDTCGHVGTNTTAAPAARPKINTIHPMPTGVDRRRWRVQGDWRRWRDQGDWRFFGIRTVTHRTALPAPEAPPTSHFETAHADDRSDYSESCDPTEGRSGSMYSLLFSFFIGAVLWGLAIHAVRWFVDREVGHDWKDSLLLGFGVKVAAAITVTILGRFLGVLTLVPVFYLAWAILARYGKFSEMQALAAVGLLVTIDIVSLLVH